MKLTTVMVGCFAVLLSACSSMTTISSPDAGTTLVLRDRSLALPATTQVKGTSFGNYEFKATASGAGADAQPFYGILPLKLNGGHMAADILLFAPGMFFNLRGAFRFYEVDLGNRVVRYKDDSGDPWVEYKPKPEEEARAREFFTGQAPDSGSAGAQ